MRKPALTNSGNSRAESAAKTNLYATVTDARFSSGSGILRHENEGQIRAEYGIVLSLLCCRFAVAILGLIHANDVCACCAS